jgi:hypothetical protein
VLLTSASNAYRLSPSPLPFLGGKAPRGQHSLSPVPLPCVAGRVIRTLRPDQPRKLSSLVIAVPSLAFICNSGEILPFQSTVFAPVVVWETGSVVCARRLFPDGRVLVLAADRGGRSHGGKGR